MFCENCKKDLPEFPQICPNCGKRTSLYGFNLNTVEGIKLIDPYIRQNNVDMINQIYYVLQRMATVFKREKKMDLAIECLRKSNEISDTYEHNPLAQKDYMRLVSFLKNAKRNDEALQAEKDINLKHPEFKDRRISNLKGIKDCLENAKKWEYDIVIVTTNNYCQFCKHCNNKKYSISGNSNEYPKLPEEIRNNGGYCNECYLGMHIDFNDLDDED